MLNAKWKAHSAFSNVNFFASPALAVLFFALHLPYLPRSLEDVDSIDFALGLHAFDVARHQPHPPGYPLFIVLAKAVRVVVGSDAHALALLGVVAGALGILAIGALVRRVGGGFVAVILAAATPLYWFTANRPLSDMTGLAAAVAVQALIVSVDSSRSFAVAAFCAGLAVGLRSQVLWLTAPLLIVSGFGSRDSGVDRRRTTSDSRVPTAVAYVAGVLLWAVPLVMITGGPAAYWRAVSAQGSEDLSGIRMLWTTPTPRELVDALYYAFVAPWAVWWLAAIILTLAAIGVVVLWRRDRRVLMLIATAFGPYLLFDVLFQETFTSRYALPLVVPLALLAARGAAVVPAKAGVAVAIAAAMFGAHVGGTSLAAYAQQPAPAFRLLDDLEREKPMQPPTIAADRREALDLRAPLKYVGGSHVPYISSATPPAQHEVLQVVEHLDGAHLVWFLADPKRTDIDLIQHGEPQRYRWGLPYPVLIDGVRPNEIDWYRLDAPEWWVGEGWALTPELAGVADADRRGLAFGAIHGRLATSTVGGQIVFGGRNFETGMRPRVEVRVDGRAVDAFEAPPGAFVRAAAIPAGNGRSAATIAVSATPPSRVAIEQFDASATRTLIAFADGWHEQEYSPGTGLRWRWLSERGDLRVVSPRPVGGLVLHLAGESPLKYFSRASTLVVRADGEPVFNAALSADFSLTIPISRPAALITVETDQTYVPAERSRRTQDRRHLGLRIFSCEIRPVSAPGR